MPFFKYLEMKAGATKENARKTEAAVAANKQRVMKTEANSGVTTEANSGANTEANSRHDKNNERHSS